jgi:hypothetical protein
MSAWKTLTFKFGAEWAPDSPYGLDVLQIAADGRFHYENRTRGETRTSSGKVAPGIVQATGIALRAAGFPAVPAHDIPPGGSLIELVVEDQAGSHNAYMDYFAALKFPGYGDLIRNFDKWTTWLRNGGATDAAPPGLTRD